MNSYFDFYTHASFQKTIYYTEVLGVFLIMLYSLKFFQVFEIVNIIFIAFKKAYFEYLILTSIIVVIFLSLSFMTYFVFGVYILEYSLFTDSILTNFKIFILSDQTDVAGQFSIYFNTFSILLMIIFIFIFRYFLLNLFFPIYFEYFRIEMENYNYNMIKDEKENLKFSTKDSIYFFLIIRVSIFFNSMENS